MIANKIIFAVDGKVVSFSDRLSNAGFTGYFTPHIQKLAVLLILAFALPAFSAGCKDGGKEFRRFLRSAARSNDRSESPHSKPKRDQAKAELGSVDHPEAITSCPEGARIYGSPPPQGTYQYCAVVGPDGKTYKNGPYRRWHKNGKMRSSIGYLDGKYHGPFLEWFPNGSPKIQGGFHGGEKHGLFTSWSKTGTKNSEEHWHNGQRHGKARFWTRRGTMEKEGSYKEGLEHGVWKVYQQTGNLRSKITYAGGAKHGRAEFYDKNGSLISGGVYKKDLEHGPWTTYWPDGHSKSIGSFIDGTPHGVWQEFSKNGTLRKTTVYQRGAVVKTAASEKREPAERSRKPKRSRKGNFGKGDILGAQPPVKRSQPSQIQLPPQKLQPIEHDNSWVSM